MLLEEHSSPLAFPVLTRIFLDFVLAKIAPLDHLPPKSRQLFPLVLMAAWLDMLSS